MTMEITRCFIVRNDMFIPCEVPFLPKDAALKLYFFHLPDVIVVPIQFP
jgi:hypothetical protein